MTRKSSLETWMEAADPALRASTPSQAAPLSVDKILILASRRQARRRRIRWVAACGLAFLGGLIGVAFQSRETDPPFSAQRTLAGSHDEETLLREFHEDLSLLEQANHTRRVQTLANNIAVLARQAREDRIRSRAASDALAAMLIP